MREGMQLEERWGAGESRRKEEGGRREEGGGREEEGVQDGEWGRVEEGEGKWRGKWRAVHERVVCLKWLKGRV